MGFSRVFFKLVKLYVLLWAVYMGVSTRIEAWNKAVFDEKVAPVFMQAGSSNASLSLVFAHPDDEVMFFAPALLQLDRFLPTDIGLNVVCLSTGNADNLGRTRERELQQSVNLLFANSERDVQLFQYDFTDGMHVTWDVEDISKVVTDQVLSPQNADREILLTFDAHGVSSHANHIACHRAVERMLRHNSNVHSAIYLDSHSGNFVLKYSAFVWDLTKILVGKFLGNANSRDATLVSTYPQYLLSLATMANAHRSQLVWFRYGWWFFSRFAFVNDLKIVNK